MEREFCGGPACWVAHLLRAGRGLFPGTAGAAGVRVYLWVRILWVLGCSGVYVFWGTARCGCGWWRGLFWVQWVARVLWMSGRPPIYACGRGVVYLVAVRGPVGWGVFCVRSGPGSCCVVYSVYGRDLWPLVYPVCAWEPWRLGLWREVFCEWLWCVLGCARALLGSAYSGCGWAPLLLGVLSALGLSCLL